MNNNTWLAHHGILGQKWGVRRFQNPDGTLTESGKQRYANQLAKQYKRERKQFSSQPWRTSENFKNSVKQELQKVITEEDTKKLLQKKNEWLNESKKAVDFDESKDYEKLIKDAHDNAMSYYKNNLPEELDYMMKKANGDHAAIADYFKAFRMVEDGYIDENWDAYSTRYYKNNPGVLESRKKAQKLYEEYKTECKNVTDKILANYGKRVVYKDSTAQYDLNKIISENSGLWEYLNEAEKRSHKE